MAEIYNTDRFAQLYQGSHNPPVQNLGLAARYLIALFKKCSITHAIFGGWALYVRGAPRRCENVDFTVGCTMEDMKWVLGPKHRLCLPLVHGRTCLQIFIWTGGEWDSRHVGVNERAVGVNIVLNGNLCTPPDLPTGMEMVWPIPRTTQGSEAVPVIRVFFEFTGKLQAHHDRRRGEPQNTNLNHRDKDFGDLEFLVRKYGMELWGSQMLFNLEHRQTFFFEFASKWGQKQEDIDYFAQVLGVMGTVRVDTPNSSP